MKATIEASPSVLVVLDREALPLKRLWCLYEIGSSPPEKLILLTHGFDESHLGAAYSNIDANKAECFEPSDETRIRAHVHQMMVEHRTVSEGADVTTALTAFSGLLKLLLILKPMSYAEDMAALLARAPGHAEYPLNPVQDFVSLQSENVESKEGAPSVSSGRLACIMGGAGEGKSTLAAALVARKWLDAIHFCKKADIRRQDKALVIRSLSYQIASRHADFA